MFSKTAAKVMAERTVQIDDLHSVIRLRQRQTSKARLKENSVYVCMISESGMTDKVATAHPHCRNRSCSCESTSIL